MLPIHERIGNLSREVHIVKENGGGGAEEEKTGKRRKKNHQMEILDRTEKYLEKTTNIAEQRVT